MIKLSDVKFDCRHFKGNIPCNPNKLHNVMCDNCEYYDKYDEKILIIKLGAAGDVIRTTPLLHPLKKEFPNSKIYWVTYSPELVPKKTGIKVDEVLKFDLQNLSYLHSAKFDLVINLDKDYEAISLTENIKAKDKKGFTIKDGYCFPIGKSAEHKFLTGIFDNVSKANKKSYLEEIFEICGYTFKGEDYLIDIDSRYDKDWPINTNLNVVGLNTGCGDRWTSRLWKNDNWIELIKMLKDANYEVVLLGGPAEDEKNRHFKEVTGAKYFGVFDLPTFINLVNKCNIVVTQVTMSMHIAIATGKKLVLMNNIFNPDEFELYGRGKIIQPRKECKCYFQPKCINEEYDCMNWLLPEDVFRTCQDI